MVPKNVAIIKSAPEQLLTCDGGDEESFNTCKLLDHIMFVFILVLLKHPTLLFIIVMKNVSREMNLIHRGKRQIIMLAIVQYIGLSFT